MPLASFVNPPIQPQETLQRDLASIAALASALTSSSSDSEDDENRHTPSASALGTPLDSAVNSGDEAGSPLSDGLEAATANQLPTSDAENDGYDYSDEDDHLGPGSRRMRRSYRARHYATRSTQATAHVPHRRIKAPHLHETLVFCYLGSVWLRQPITLTDLLVYVQNR